jgi:hypothetical protein
MNKTISTRVGLITGITIIAFLLILVKLHVPADSPFSLFQFGGLFAGVMVSCYLLFHYYAGIKFTEAFTHCMKTVATILMMVILGNSVLFFMFAAPEHRLQQFTFLLMKTLFAYGISGIFSSLFASYIFNTFTKK